MFDISAKSLNYLYRLKNITRYNHRARVKDENVAEHSYFVGLISLILTENIEGINEKQKLQILQKSILHDIPEIELNDVTHDVKVKYPEIAKALEKENNNFIKNKLSKHATLFNEEDNIVNLVVKLADTISVLQYVLNEIELGNCTLDDIEEGIEERVKNVKERINKIGYEINIKI